MENLILLTKVLLKSIINACPKRDSPFGDKGGQMNWTYEQSKAIETRNKNILVAAAAGSGKTAVLVERIIRFILEEHVDLDKLLVVTFTNAAASQMREKILEAIYKKLEENPENQELQRQIVLMNKASISTIHSFCLEVIRNYFYEIDISANFRIGDSAEIELLKQDAILELFEEKYEAQDEKFQKLLDCYTDYHGDEQLQEIVLKTYEFIQSSPFPEEWLEKAAKSFNREGKIEEDFANTIWGKILLESYIEELKKYRLEYMIMKQNLSRYPEAYEAYKTLCKDIDNISNMIEHSTTWKNAANVAYIAEFPKWKTDKKADLSIQEQTKEKRTKVNRALKEYVKAFFTFDSKQANEDINQMYPVLKALSELIVEFTDKYARKKKEKNLIDFSDIEHMALKILVKKNENGEYEKTEVAKAYTEKFVAIAIDEYQDSNLIQEYLLTTISRGNNIFMVGDVKQSIYKFRQARPELFLEKYDTYPKVEVANGDAAKIQLFKNFRSRKNILNITNLVFESIMTRALRRCGI